MPDEWFHSHLMDDPATVSPTFTPKSKNMVNEPEDNEEMIDEVDHDFVIEECIGQVHKDSIEASMELPGLLSPDSLHEAVTTELCKPTKTSGDDPLFNRWIDLIDERKAKNKGPVVLSEIARARVDTNFPIVYCTDLEKKHKNDKDWDPFVKEDNPRPVQSLGCQRGPIIPQGASRM